MDSIERALAARTMPAIIEEEAIRRSSTEASPPAGPTDSRQQPSALRIVESSHGGDNSLGSMSLDFSAVLAGVQERLPISRMNRPYRESALRDGPRFVRNPSQDRASDSSEGILDRNAILDCSGGIASEADINEYRQWCLERLASSRQGANPQALTVASAERSPVALPNDTRHVPHDGAREPTTPGHQRTLLELARLEPPPVPVYAAMTQRCPNSPTHSRFSAASKLGRLSWVRPANSAFRIRRPPGHRLPPSLHAIASDWIAQQQDQ